MTMLLDFRSNQRRYCWQSRQQSLKSFQAHPLPAKKILWANRAHAYKSKVGQYGGRNGERAAAIWISCYPADVPWEQYQESGRGTKIFIFLIRILSLLYLPEKLEWGLLPGKCLRDRRQDSIDSSCHVHVKIWSFASRFQGPALLIAWSNFSFPCFRKRRYGVERKYCFDDIFTHVFTVIIREPSVGLTHRECEFTEIEFFWDYSRSIQWFRVAQKSVYSNLKPLNPTWVCIPLENNGRYYLLSELTYCTDVIIICFRVRFNAMRMTL